MGVEKGCVVVEFAGDQILSVTFHLGSIYNIRLVDCS